MDNESVTTIEENADVAEKTKSKKTFFIRLAVIAVAVLLLGIAAVRIMFVTGVINPYERDYVDVTGRTAADLAKEKGLAYDKFLEFYGLPDDMPKNTSERAVFYNIPVRIFVEKNASFGTFDELKTAMGWDDSILPETTMGEALDKTKLSYYVGEEQLERFKGLYELPDDVNGDTLYGEVRNMVDSKDKEYREADEAAEAIKEE